MEQLWAPWRMAYVGSAKDGVPECFLCAAAEGGGGSHVIDLAERTVIMLNRFPYSSGHTLVAPRRHVADITELTAEEGVALAGGVRDTVQALRSTVRAEGFNVGLNLGAVAGASVEHVHLHVVPRWAGDTNFMPVLGDVKVIPEHLDATAAALREAFRAARTG